MPNNNLNISIYLYSTYNNLAIKLLIQQKN